MVLFTKDRTVQRLENDKNLKFWRVWQASLACVLEQSCQWTEDWLIDVGAAFKYHRVLTEMKCSLRCQSQSRSGRPRAKESIEGDGRPKCMLRMENGVNKEQLINCNRASETWEPLALCKSEFCSLSPSTCVVYLTNLNVFTRHCLISHNGNISFIEAHRWPGSEQKCCQKVRSFGSAV